MSLIGIVPSGYAPRTKRLLTVSRFYKKAARHTRFANPMAESNLKFSRSKSVFVLCFFCGKCNIYQLFRYYAQKIAEILGTFNKVSKHM